jgi:hypothetical protein
MYYLRTRAAADAIKFTVDQQALQRRRTERAVKEKEKENLAVVGGALAAGVSPAAAPRVGKKSADEVGALAALDSSACVQTASSVIGQLCLPADGQQRRPAFLCLHRKTTADLSLASGPCCAFPVGSGPASSSSLACASLLNEQSRTVPCPFPPAPTPFPPDSLPRLNRAFFPALHRHAGGR